jgi:hypothetical protein
MTTINQAETKFQNHKLKELKAQKKTILSLDWNTDSLLATCSESIKIWDFKQQVFLFIIFKEKSISY